MKCLRDKPVCPPINHRVLVIMAKAPRRGAVKTRLALSLSPEAVTDFYCCLLEDTLALARSFDDVEIAIRRPDAHVTELPQLPNSEASGREHRIVAHLREGL